MTKGWDEKRRKRQAARCRQNKPWESATGPKTEAGKARAALNALKHGGRSRAMAEVRYLLWLNREFVKRALQYYQTPDLSQARTNELKEAIDKINKNKRLKK